MDKDNELGQHSVGENDLVNMYVKNENGKIVVVQVPFKTWWEQTCNSGGVPGSKPPTYEPFKPFTGFRADYTSDK